MNNVLFNFMGVWYMQCQWFPQQLNSISSYNAESINLKYFMSTIQALKNTYWMNIIIGKMTTCRFYCDPL